MALFHVDTTTSNIRYNNDDGYTIVVVKNTRNLYLREFVLVSGTQVVPDDTYSRIGAATIDPSSFNVHHITFEVNFLTSDPAYQAVIRLFNVTDNAEVALTPMTTLSTTGSVQSATISLSNSSKVYEVQLKLATAAAGHAAACTRATINIFKDEIGF